MKKLFSVAAAVSISLATFFADAQTPRFTRDTSVSGYPVVADNKTGLEWQGCHAGWMGDACTTDDPAVTGDTFTWQNALSYCENLSWAGHDDWRLPDTTELLNIVDYRYSSPSIDPVAFPATPATPGNYFWSSSSRAVSASNAYYVSFGNGYVDYYGKTSNLFGYPYARCVRSGP